MPSQIPQQVPNPPSSTIHSHLTNPTNSAPLQASTSQWAVWDGHTTSFSSFLLQLKIEIEEERIFLGSNRSICLNILRSIPATKQPRILHWFEVGGPDGSYNYSLFLDHIKEQFENKQARQKAGNFLQRMRMGSSQYFVDYLQDFELKVAQCRGMSDSSKIMHLHTGINSRLRLLLLSKSLPDDNYLK